MHIITIDGPVATGKSTIAKKLAERLGYIYLDTGAMYRCLTLEILRKNIDLKDKSALIALLNHFDFTLRREGSATHYYVNKCDVTQDIRDRTVTAAVSEVAAIPEVRTLLVKKQQELAEGLEAVVEGRDMGTVVFPDAKIKFFLTGRGEVRARRRYEELLRLFPQKRDTISLELIQKELEDRDAYDSGREHSPLRQAEDAYVIDTSDYTLDEILEKMIIYVRSQSN